MGRQRKSPLPYGEGSVFFNKKSGYWCGQTNVGTDENGKMKRKTVYGKSQKEVKEKIKKIRLAIYNGDFVNPSSVTFEQLEKQILDDKLAMNEFHVQTYHRNLETLKILTPIAKEPLQKINYSMLKQFLISLVDNYSDSTIKKIYRMLNQCFEEAKKRKLISENPMADLKKPKSRKTKENVRALAVDEQKAFIEALKVEKNQYENQFLISMLSGMRCGEVNALTLEDINLEHGFINVYKTMSKGENGKPFVNSTTKTINGVRKVPINDLLKPIIEKIVEEFKGPKDGLLFHTSTGTIVATNSTNYEFQRIIKKYNIKDKSVKGKISQHSLRHTYATRCVEGQMPPKVLQSLLGHADIKTTLDIYSSVFDEYQSENVKKVDDYLSKIGISI